MRKHEVKGRHLRNFRRGQIETFLGERNFRPQLLFYAGFPFYSPLWRDLAMLLSEKRNNYADKEISQILKFFLNAFIFLFGIFQHGEGSAKCSVLYF